MIEHSVWPGRETDNETYRQSVLVIRAFRIRGGFTHSCEVKCNQFLVFFAESGRISRWLKYIVVRYGPASRGCLLVLEASVCVWCVCVFTCFYPASFHPCFCSFSLFLSSVFVDNNGTVVYGKVCLQV